MFSPAQPNAYQRLMSVGNNQINRSIKEERKGTDDARRDERKINSSSPLLNLPNTGEVSISKQLMNNDVVYDLVGG